MIKALNWRARICDKSRLGGFVKHSHKNLIEWENLIYTVKTETRPQPSKSEMLKKKIETLKNNVENIRTVTEKRKVIDEDSFIVQDDSEEKIAKI